MTTTANGRSLLCRQNRDGTLLCKSHLGRTKLRGIRLNLIFQGNVGGRLNYHRKRLQGHEVTEINLLAQIGGCKFGGYVNDVGQNNPTYQFFPPRGDNDIVALDLLNRTLPTNLYPLTWLLPSGKLLIQSNWATSLLDYRTNEETALDDIPDAVRVYPASAGSIMLPLTPENNWVATIMFCGGSNVATDQWASRFIPP